MEPADAASAAQKGVAISKIPDTMKAAVFESKGRSWQQQPPLNQFC